MQKTTVQILEDAKAAIQKHGWVKGYVGSVDVGFCMMGALKYATYGDVSKPIMFGGAYSCLSRSIPGGGVASYNDDDMGDGAKSVEDIYKVFDKAIELAKEHERVTV